MRPTPLLACLVLLAACLLGGCNDETVDDTGDGGHEWDPESTLCGTVRIADTGCAGSPLPGSAGVWTVRGGASACVVDTSSGAGDWVDELVAQPEVDEDGFFEAAVEPGDYGVAACTDTCEDCRPVTVDGEGCTQVALVLHSVLGADARGVSLRRPGRTVVMGFWPPYFAAEARSSVLASGRLTGRETSSNQSR